MQQSCGTSRTQFINGMDWNGHSIDLFLKPDVMDLTIVIKYDRITTKLLKNDSIYTYTYHYIRLTH